MNNAGTIAVVHNGIIENYIPLKKKMQDKGYQFISETDTEVLAHLLDYYYKGNPLEAITKVLHRVEAPMRWVSCLPISLIRSSLPAKTVL